MQSALRMCMDRRSTCCSMKSFQILMSCLRLNFHVTLCVWSMMSATLALLSTVHESSSNTSWIVRLHVCWLLQSQTCQKQSSNTVWLHWNSAASTRCLHLSPIPVTQLRLPAKTSSSNSPPWLCIRILPMLTWRALCFGSEQALEPQFVQCLALQCTEPSLNLDEQTQKHTSFISHLP